MEQRIIYMNDSELCIVTPTPEVLKSYTIDEVAKKDVPSGIKYKIVNFSDIPTDRQWRAAWYIDESELTDGIGSDTNTFQGIK